MSTDLQMAWTDKVTSINVNPQYPVGRRRFENGREYIYQQADDTIAVNSAVKLDITASASGLKVTPVAAAGDSLFGVAETAITDEYYGWITVRGVASALVATGVAADDPLTTASGGALSDAVEAGSGDYKFCRCSAMEANASGGTLAKNVYLY